MPDEVVEVQGAQPSAMDRFWLETARNAAKESIRSLEEAAKQLITVTSLTQGIYFAAISFSDLKRALVVQDEKGWLLVLLFASPIIFWLISLGYAILVFTPETYKTNLQSPRSGTRDASGYNRLQAQAASNAYHALLIGFLLLVANIVIYLGCMPQAAAK